MHRFVSALALVTPLVAQSTWIVNAGGGPGVNFTDLPSAVAAASSGDTILVQTGPFGEGATPFSTSKGLTIVGVGGLVPISSASTARYEITNLPLGETFCMVGFDRPWDGELNFRIDNCQGRVHLDRLRCRENQAFLPTWPSIEITDSGDVTLREVSTFGSPAVAITNSDVDLVHCQLGVTYIGLAGGMAVSATDSTVDVVQPRFDTGFGATAAIVTDNCTLTITGHAQVFGNLSYVRNPTGAVVDATGGIVRHDPMVQLEPQLGTPAITGSAAVVSATLPATWCAAAIRGQPLLLQSRAPANAFVWLALGTPAPTVGTPLGPLSIDPFASPLVFGPSIATTLGITSLTINVPAGALLGSMFTSQAIVLDQGALSLGLPCTFAIH